MNISNKAILLIHGFLSDVNDFASIKDILKDYYDEVIIPNLPGHGEDMGVHPFEAEKTINMVIDAFDDLNKKYKTIDVMGYSMGGALATYLSNNRKFNKLILLAPANKYFNFKYPVSLLKIHYSLKKHIKHDEDNQIYLDKMERISIDNKYSIKVLKDYIALFEILPSYYWNFRRIIKTVNQKVNKIPNPCLIVWGEIDQLVPQSSINFVSNLCTNNIVKIKMFDDMSHLMLLSPANADTVITEIIEFIK